MTSSQPGSRRIRAVVLDHTAQLGGAELALARLLDGLPSDEFEVHTILFADGPLVERLRRAGHHDEVIPLGAHLGERDRHTAGRSLGAVGRQALAALPFAWRLARRLRVLDVDVIHTTSLKADLIGVPVSWLARRPLVWHVHDRISADYLPEPAVRLIQALARRVPSAVIANSEATADTLPGARNLAVAYPGLVYEQVTGQLPPPPDPPVVGILGRISETKGQLEFVRAAARVLESHPDARFRIVGAPLFGHEAYEAQVRSEVAKLGIPNQVEFVGFAQDPAAELDALSVCVHASGTPEPFGQVVVESMARGVPVVATRGGGVTEIVEPNDREPLGLLVPPHDVRALADAIREVLDRPSEARERAAKAQGYAVEQFGIDRTAAVVGSVWRQASRRGAAGRWATVPEPRTRSSAWLDAATAAEAGHQEPSIAIAHDYLTQRGGAERVVLALMRAFPGAPVYTTLYDPAATYPEFREATVITSPLNRVAALRRNHRVALPLLPIASRSLRIPHDVVVTSSSGWAHGFSTEGRTLVYCHAPARWLYQSEAYLGSRPGGSFKGLVLVVLRPWLRRWDRRAARRPDRYLANSSVVRDRIREAYGIDADIIFPPHSMEPTAAQAVVEQAADWAEVGYYLVVSRLLPYKNVHHVVEAFRGLDERLLIVGAGPMEGELRDRLRANVRLVSGLDDAQIRWAYSHATALVAPSLEDFGLTPIEAGAFGKPTLALRAGGYLDTIRPGVNGIFFEAPTPEAIRAAIVANRRRKWSSERIRRHVDTFSEDRFRRRLREEVASLWQS